MLEIPLTQGRVALIDDADYQLVAPHKWHLTMKKKYVGAWIGGNKVSLHRFLLGAGVGEFIDHVNGNGLDNRRANLRVCMRRQNQRNMKKHSDNSSGYKGVGWNKDAGKYRADIYYDGHGHFLGHFVKPEDAARAYDNAALEHFGEYARLNFPEECSL